MLSDPSFRHSTRERTDFWLFLPNFGRDRSSFSQIQSVIRVQTHNSFLPGSYHTRTKVLSFAVTCHLHISEEVVCLLFLQYFSLLTWHSLYFNHLVLSTFRQCRSAVRQAHSQNPPNSRVSLEKPLSLT